MTNNFFGTKRMGSQQRKILQLILDNGGIFPPGFVISYVERKTLESLMPKGFARIRDGRWFIPNDKRQELESVYGIKERA